MHSTTGGAYLITADVYSVESDAERTEINKNKRVISLINLNI